ncbi:permease [Gymnodinialimonas ceratoperidinii]|uniref:Permease n=1 Tax=Gymnodinialimonas ceratoperidinii TaxID=2856823 RepID=A0A8F6YDJ7_9RHOB|nr:permease [Gymnodinialimonas ceratoperidinii]QXT40540.1 permease [Gymnodinialimonas ceratoperidinii]
MTDQSLSPRLLPSLWGRIDRVALTGALILLVLAIFDRPAVVPTIEETLEHFWGTLPFILFAVLAIGYMKATGSERLLDGAFQGREMRMIVMGALVGGLSPFCSCQVIPFVAALLAAGAPLSAVMAFWLASPLMDPAMFSITAGGIGFDFAVAKTIAAVGLGIMGGFTVKMLANSAVFADPLRAQPASAGCCSGKKLTLNWKFWQDADRRSTFGRTTWDNLLFLGKWLMFAYLLQSLLISYVPADLIAQVIGGDGLMPILIGALVGAPAYLNGYAAVPLVGGLMEQGMSPGAGMAFMVAGGVSCIPAAVAVWALVKPRIFVAYLALALSGAVIAGIAWSFVA